MFVVAMEVMMAIEMMVTMKLMFVVMEIMEMIVMATKLKNHVVIVGLK